MSNHMIATLEAQEGRALAAADEILKLAESGRRKLSANESQLFDKRTREATETRDEIRRIQLKAMPRTSFSHESPIPGQERMMPKKLTADYWTAFFADLPYGLKTNAALLEGNSGGNAVPIVVDGQTVPLAPQDLAVRSRAHVIETVSDIKFPYQTVQSTATARAEGSSFVESYPALGSFLLSAFTVGQVESVLGVELTQDNPLLVSEFVFEEDAGNAVQEAEEVAFISGTGSGQPQGLLGNVGTGVTEEPDGNGNLVSINGTLDLLGKLKNRYHRNATWLMQRATSLIIRKAQVGTDLFTPAWTRENGVDLLHGYPVDYSTAVPTAQRGNTPILFGDFYAGYVIGDRGGSALRCKVLDQAGAAQGLITLLTYRRTDGRVRIAEAIQSYSISAS